MQQGRTITLDVIPDDTVGEVKTKLEAKTGIPATTQRLYFNGKGLMDNHALREYGVLEESNLQLHLQAGSTATLVPKTPETGMAVDWDKKLENWDKKLENWDKKLEKMKLEMSNLKKEIGNSFNESNLQLHLQAGSTATLVPKAPETGIAVDWDMLAYDAKSKVDEQIHQKKEAYDDLMKKRENLIKQMEFRSKAFDEASSQVLSKDEEVASREQELRRAKQLHQESLRERNVLQELKQSASDQINETRGKLEKVELEISDLNKEIGNSFDIDICPKKSDSFKEIMMEAITQKEVDLQCPVCLLVKPPPLYKCKREHLICSECFSRVHNKCPTCRGGYSRDDKIFRLAEQNWRDLQKLKSKLD